MIQSINDVCKTLMFTGFFLMYGQVTAQQNDIVINEFMAINTAYTSDEEGQFDDYIELRNNSATNYQNLKDWHLTDTLGIIDKWKFPDEATLAPHGYLVIWADEDGGQGDLHCNFKLDGDGEELYLVNPNGEIVDQVIFGAQTEDMSFSRIPNGTGDFQIKNGTIGFNNEDLSSINSFYADAFQIYPNPVNEKLNIDNIKGIESFLEIYDMKGNKVFSQIIGSSNTSINLSEMTTGLYYITINGILLDRFVKL